MTEVSILVLVFALAFIAGRILISRVPQMLHTPLMSMTNALSAVTVIGALVLFSAETSWTEAALGAMALVMASFNLVGGFAITDRMLGLFRKGGSPQRPSDARRASP